MNKILKEYIIKNTGEKFEETPFGQIVVDEINKAVSELPEIKLALEQMSTQPDPELEANVRDLGRGYAIAALNKVRDVMAKQLPTMVEEILDDLMKQANRAR